MDFKCRFSIAPTWPNGSKQLTWPEPYDVASSSSLFTLTPIDGSGTFLNFCHAFSDENFVSSSYAIEAPVDCPVRHAFESSQMSWMDYWHHKGWLLYVSIPLTGNHPITTRYIRPDELCQRTVKKFQELGNDGPYELKRQILELKWENTSWNGRCPKEAERKYRDFMLRNAARFPRDAA